jgi:hypothetical protein
MTWRRLAWIGALNVPFALCHPSAPLLGGELWRSLAIGAVLFLLPGVPAATWLGRKRDHPPPLIAVVALSLAAFVMVVVGAHVLRLPLRSGGVWNMLWGLTNAGVVAVALTAQARPSMSRGPGRRDLLPVVLFAAAYLACFQGSVRVVPATADHDFELQGTVHSLLTSLEPRFFTTRGTTHYFAHPPIAHVYVAGSFLFYDRWTELALYDPAPGTGRPDLDSEFRHYLEHPYRLETRTPNVFLAALTVARLGALVAGMAGAALASLLAAAYLFSPEVFVRSSYGGYFAIGTFALMEIARAEEDRQRARPWARRAAGLAGAYAALADHKLMVVVGALFLWEALREKATPLAAVRRAVRHPTVVGFAAGTALFWIYGLSVSPTSFWNDHLHHHLIDRILHHHTWNVEELGAYPSVALLWREFARDTGWLLLPLAAASFALLLRDPPGWRGTTGFWLAWTVVTAGAFSVVDWRQTKHLAILILPLYLVLARAGGRGPRLRLAVAAGLATLLAFNLPVLAGLANNFESLAKAPEW